EEALFDDGVFAVPEGQGEAEALLIIGETGKAILATAVGTASGLIVGEVVPGVSRVAVVFAHGTPLALAEVRAPLAPGDVLFAGFFEARLLGVHGVAPCGLRSHAMRFALSNGAGCSAAAAARSFHGVAASTPSDAVTRMTRLSPTL